MIAGSAFTLDGTTSYSYPTGIDWWTTPTLMDAGDSVIAWSRVTLPGSPYYWLMLNKINKTTLTSSALATGTWASDQGYPLGYRIIDLNGTIQMVVNTGAGYHASGAVPPVWNTTAGGLTTDGELTWLCMLADTTVTLLPLNGWSPRWMTVEDGTLYVGIDSQNPGDGTHQFRVDLYDYATLELQVEGTVTTVSPDTAIYADVGSSSFSSAYSRGNYIVAGACWGWVWIYDKTAATSNIVGGVTSAGAVKSAAVCAENGTTYRFWVDNTGIHITVINDLSAPTFTTVGTISTLGGLEVVSWDTIYLDEANGFFYVSVTLIDQSVWSTISVADASVAILETLPAPTFFPGCMQYGWVGAALQGSSTFVYYGDGRFFLNFPTGVLRDTVPAMGFTPIQDAVFTGTAIYTLESLTPPVQTLKRYTTAHTVFAPRIQSSSGFYESFRQIVPPPVLTGGTYYMLSSHLPGGNGGIREEVGDFAAVNIGPVGFFEFNWPIFYDQNAWTYRWDAVEVSADAMQSVIDHHNRVLIRIEGSLRWAPDPAEEFWIYETYFVAHYSDGTDVTYRATESGVLDGGTGTVSNPTFAWDGNVETCAVIDRFWFSGLSDPSFLALSGYVSEAKGMPQVWVMT